MWKLKSTCLGCELFAKTFCRVELGIERVAVEQRRLCVGSGTRVKVRLGGEELSPGTRDLKVESGRQGQGL